MAGSLPHPPAPGHVPSLVGLAFVAVVVGFVGDIVDGLHGLVAFGLGGALLISLTARVTDRLRRA